MLVRKKGKLPPPVVELPYRLEYGTGVLEMQAGSGRLLLVDDVLATGGTLKAAAALAELAGYSVFQSIVLLDLKLNPAVPLGPSASPAPSSTIESLVPVCGTGSSHKSLPACCAPATEHPADNTVDRASERLFSRLECFH